MGPYSSIYVQAVPPLPIRRVHSLHRAPTPRGEGGGGGGGGAPSQLLKKKDLFFLKK